MPTVILQGGLGNQLFQYAVGKALSLKTDSDLYLEKSSFTRSPDPDLPSRKLHLNNFLVEGKLIQKPIYESTLLKGRYKLFSLLRRVNPELAARTCGVHKDLQDPHRFIPYVLNLPGNTVFYGYYQSEKYFRSIRERLQRELSLPKKPSGRYRAWHQRIEQCNSVSIHIRRSEYAELGWALPADYYRSAIEKMTSLTDEAVLFFFSLDMDWTKTNIEKIIPDDFPMPNVNFIDWDEKRRACEDLRLMRKCNHNIIANSTFSWWGAWLNQTQEKIVLTPTYWLHDHVGNLDIIPDEWNTVEY